MSFADLKSRRAKSYVYDRHHPSPSTSTSSLTSSDHPTPPAPVTNALYPDLPTILEVRTSPTSGRGIWTASSITPGTVIFATTPHVRVLSTRHLASFCSACIAPYRTGSTLQRCTKCKVMQYCDSACQNADWVMHKRECPALVRWADSVAPPPAPTSGSSNSAPTPMPPSIPSDAIRCLARIIWTRKLAGNEGVLTQQIDAMQSHRLSSPSGASKQAETQTYLAHALTRYLGVSSPDQLAAVGVQGIGGLVDLISKFTTNTHTLTTPTLTPIGLALSPLVALANHSCVPNAVVVFPTASPKAVKPMRVIAIREIQPEDEVLISYVDTTLPRLTRLTALRETYNFVCPCPLCDMPSAEPDPRQAARCRKLCGGLWACTLPNDGKAVVETACAKCGAVVPAEVVAEVSDAIRVGGEALDEAGSIQFTNHQRAHSLTKNALTLLTSPKINLLPTTHPVLALMRLGVLLGIDALSHAPPTPRQAQETLDGTIRLATMSAQALDVLMAKGHPVRALAWAELGRLCAVDEFDYPLAQVSTEKATTTAVGSSNGDYPPHGPPRLKLAHATLVRALEELRIGFGSDGGESGKEVREAIVRLEEEMGIWRAGMKALRGH